MVAHLLDELLAPEPPRMSCNLVWIELYLLDSPYGGRYCLC